MCNSVQYPYPTEGSARAASARLCARIGYAVSWWAAADAAAALGAADAREPIGEMIAPRETRRELLAVSRTAAHAALDAALGVDRAAAAAGDLWARWYYIISQGRVLCLVHEVFSPRLQELGLGPQGRAL